MDIPNVQGGTSTGEPKDRDVLSGNSASMWENNPKNDQEYSGICWTKVNGKFEHLIYSYLETFFFDLLKQNFQQVFNSEFNTKPKSQDVWKDNWNILKNMFFLTPRAI